jgi:hypothetical protein
MKRLQASDLVVYVEVHRLRSGAGQMTLLSSAGGVRRVRIALDAHLSTRDQIVVLGHELFHALEVASAPEVRDETSLRAFYDRIGFTVGRKCGVRYDTTEARATARTIAQEVDTLRGVEGAWTPR